MSASHSRLAIGHDRGRVRCRSTMGSWTSVLSLQPKPNEQVGSCRLAYRCHGRRAARPQAPEGPAGPARFGAGRGLGVIASGHLPWRPAEDPWPVPSLAVSRLGNKPQPADAPPPGRTIGLLAADCDAQEHPCHKSGRTTGHRGPGAGVGGGVRGRRGLAGHGLTNYHAPFSPEGSIESEGAQTWPWCCCSITSRA